MNKEEFSIDHCNIPAMLADYFTKPLQGSLFLRLREVVMGWTHVDTLQNCAPPPKKERVKNHIFGE